MYVPTFHSIIILKFFFFNFCPTHHIVDTIHSIGQTIIGTLFNKLKLIKALHNFVNFFYF